MNFTKLAVLAAALLAVFLSGNAQQGAMPSQEVAATVPLGPLPGDVVPTHYDLALTIVPDRERFEGHVKIMVDIAAPTDLIWLHGKELDVSQATAIDANGHSIAMTFAQVEATGVARLDLERVISAGPAVLDMTFSAPFNQRLEGLYRVDEGGLAYAFTQMQATSARLAFPGFDEPAYKTPFDIILTVPADEVAIANTPVAEVMALDGGLKRVRFATTKPMPTELLAWAVGELDVVEWQPLAATDLRDREVPLRGITAKGKGGKIKYALANTEAIVNILENYFSIPYPYAKLDIIAVPDFAAGAMENIGAITYREQLMLFEDPASLAQKRRYAGTNAHELAHQWFGDLVTPKWWNDIWLNEAFATWMGNHTIHEWQPDQQFDRAFRRSVLGVMAVDSLQSTRQVRQPVHDNHGIANAFDGITYQKGGGVIAMFENYLGAERFRAGVHHHLSRFAHATATSQDFMESLAQATGDTSVVAAFTSFLDQPGLPLVKAALSCAPGAKPLVTLEQSRYYPLGSKGRGGQQWQIPVCLAYGDGGQQRQQCLLMTEARQSVTLDTNACPGSLMPNAKGAGYYRWTLPTDGWTALLGDLDKYSATEALSMADSFAAAVRAGELDSDRYLASVKQFSASKYWDVSVAPMSMLRFIDDYLTPDDLKPALRQFFTGLYGGKLRTLGLTADSPSDAADPISTALLRGRIVDFLANSAKLPGLRAELAARGGAYVGYGGDGKIHVGAIIPDLVGTALSVAAEDLGAPFVDALLTAVEGSSDAVFRQQAISAISGVADPAVAARVRKLILSPDLRDNEAVVILFVQANRMDTRDGLWDWMRKNMDALVDRIPSWSRGRLAGVGGGFCSADRRAEVDEFFRPRVAALEGGPRSLAQALERIDLCMALVADQEQATARFFAGK